MDHIAVFAFLCLAGPGMTNSFAEEIPYPVLRVPRVLKPPTIDGRIDEAEWSSASSVTGVATWCAEGAPGQPPIMVPEIQQVRWFLGYDSKRLYLAMLSPHPKGTALTANIKKNDEGHRILWDDHTEIQFSPRGRSYPGGFYKIMVNPRGYFSDQIWYSGTPGSEDLWQSGAAIKTTASDTSWQLEMAVPFKTMSVPDSPDGHRWVLNLVRTDFCGGIYFAGWVGTSWMGWKHFPEIEFDPQAPSFHFKRIGDLPRGTLDTRIEMTSRKEKETVELQVRFLNGDRKEIHRETRSVLLEKGRLAKVNFQKIGLALSDEKKNGKYRVNHYEMVAVVKGKAETGEPDRILYQARIPVARMTERYWDQFIKPWQERRETAGDYEFNIAHYPYLNKFEAWVDLDLFGVPDHIKKAKRFSVALSDGQDKVIAELKGGIGNDLLGNVLNDIPELKEGKYSASLRLLDGAGKQVSQKVVEFVRERWPWEHNDIGRDDIVIPPYIRVKAEGNSLSVWNRKYVVGKSGLPEKILLGGGKKRPGTGPDLLGGKPISLSLKSGGNISALNGQELKFVEARSTTARLQAKSKLGPLQVSAEVTFEYDGWYRVDLTFTPQEKTSVESLEMRWTVPGADTLVVQRGDTVERGYFGAFPEGEGIVWESTSLNPAPGLLGTWAPACFIGTGDSGLWYLAESDEGWLLDDSKSCIVAERIQGRPSLRFRFINKTAVMDKPRRITFALLASPVKPLPANWRKTAWNQPGGLEFRQDTRGYRYYGASVDGFELYTEEDYKRLRDVYLGFRPAPRGGHGVRAHLSYQRPMVLYGSGRMTGVSREFKTFGGEWLGRTNYQNLLKPANSFKGKSSDGGINWQSEDQVSPTGVFHTPSFIDYHLWYHRNLAEKVLLNGTWWDNSSIAYGGPAALGLSYVRDDGSVQGKSNLFAWREQTKRLNVMHWQVGRPPLYISNMHPLYSFTQVGWHIENSFHRFQGNRYVEKLGENTGVEVFRALVRTRQGIISRFAYAGRVGLAMSLLHDIGNIGTPSYRGDVYPALKKILNVLEDNVYFFSGDPHFIPYWRSGKAVKFEKTPQVYASVYVHNQLRPWEGGNPPNRHRAVIVFFNGGEERVIDGFSIDAKSLGLTRVQRITDGETGIPIGLMYNKKKGYRFGEIHGRPETLHLRRHDFRMLVVE
ncbi:MAG: DUF6067 family protein [Planctomycetota bacterium]|nr:DUF6067 family protein [Planctomycetota bacterium]